MEKHRNLSYQEQLLEDINRAEQDKFEVQKNLILDLFGICLCAHPRRYSQFRCDRDERFLTYKNIPLKC